MNLRDVSGGCQGWQERAGCAPGRLAASGVDPGVFFPPVEDTPGACDAAKEVCARCPVQADCLTWALCERMPDGVFGGLSTPERRAVVRQSGLGQSLRLLALGGRMPSRVDHRALVYWGFGRVHSFPTELRHGGQRNRWFERDDLLVWAAQVVRAWATSERCPPLLVNSMLELANRYDLEVVA